MIQFFGEGVGDEVDFVLDVGEFIFGDDDIELEVIGIAVVDDVEGEDLAEAIEEAGVFFAEFFDAAGDRGFGVEIAEGEVEGPGDEEDGEGEEAHTGHAFVEFSVSVEEEDDTGAEDDAEDVGGEEEEGAGGEFGTGGGMGEEVGVVGAGGEGHADDAEWGDEGDGDGDAGDGVGDARPGPGEGTGGAGGDGDAEVEEVGVGAGNDLGIDEAEAEEGGGEESDGDDENDAGDNCEEGAVDEFCFEADDGVTEAHDGGHERGEEHAADDGGGAIGEEAEGCDGGGEDEEDVIVEDGEIALGEDFAHLFLGKRSVLKEVPVSSETFPEVGEVYSKFGEGRHWVEGMVLWGMVWGEDKFLEPFGGIRLPNCVLSLFIG